MRCFMPDAVGFADTGYPCRADRASAELSIITGPPPGIVSVGGDRFRLDQLQDLVGRTDPNQSLPPCRTRWLAIGSPAALCSAPRSGARSMNWA